MSWMTASYPVGLRDLPFGALDAFDPRWMESILDEMTQSVLANRPDIEAARFDARLLTATRRALPSASVEGQVCRRLRGNRPVGAAETG